MEGIIRELNSYNRKRRRKRLFAGLGLSFLGGIVLGGAFLLGQARGRIDGLEEENAGLEKELSRTEEEKDKFEDLYREYGPFDWKNPDIWERYVGGFFATLEEDPFGDKVFTAEGDHKHAANQLYNAMREHYGWKERNWPGFLQAFRSTYFEEVPDVVGEKKVILYKPLVPEFIDKPPEFFESQEIYKKFMGNDFEEVISVYFDICQDAFRNYGKKVYAGRGPNENLSDGIYQMGRPYPSWTKEKDIHGEERFYKIFNYILDHEYQDEKVDLTLDDITPRPEHEEGLKKLLGLK